MLRRPPRSTLFPSRRSSDLASTAGSSRRRRSESSSSSRVIAREVYPGDDARGAAGRSEEHTSELQSRQYLVCRLLLEKKKKTNAATHQTPRPQTHVETRNAE